MVWVCPDCSAGYALRLGACRTCGSAGPMERMVRVPKSTHAGVSNAAAGPGEVGYIEPDDDQTGDDGGGEDVSPGTSSSTSSETPDSSTTSGRAGGPKRARTTGSRSSQDQAGSSSARSTASSSPGTGSGRSSR